MTRPTFEMLCGFIGPDVAPTPGCHRPPVPTRKRIAIALYKLATCAEYRVVGETFGVYGALDGTHIPILPPTEGYRDYINCKGWPSIDLQALVDDRCMIRDICVGTPGSAHDAAVFAASDLYRHPERHPQATLVVEGVQVPLLVAGDPAYPLLPWLIKGYSGPNLSEEQEAFNRHLNGSGVKVEHTFGHLKGRWRILAKRSDIHHSFMPTVVAACCVLHNICEMEKQGFIQPCEDLCN
ncbi:unnamed protein product [Leuciscus chuanchicus]